MAQSALTVTPPNPTPPTNFGCTGATGPNPPNFTTNTYNDPKNWSAVNPKDFPPPYYDDGTAQSGIVFAPNVAALAGGSQSGANAGGTPGTYPGTGTGTTVNNVGGTPVSTSQAAEGAGTEVAVTASVPNPSPAGQLVMVSCLGNFTGIANAAGQNISPNATHASSLSPATNPTLASIAPTTSVHGTAPVTMTATGVGFTRQSVITIAGVPQKTTFVSSTSLTCTATPPAAAGTPAVAVVTGGVVTTAPQTWTIT